MSGILGFLESWDSWDCTSRPDLTRNVTPQLRPHAEVYGPPCARARSASPTRPALRQPPAWTRWTSYRNRPATTTRHGPDAVLVPLLALEVAQDEVFHARDHLLLRDEPVLLGNVILAVELA